MKIYKILSADTTSELEEKTQSLFDRLFKDYPNGAIESIIPQFYEGGTWNYYNSILFETEPKEINQEINPILLQKILTL